LLICRIPEPFINIPLPENVIFAKKINRGFYGKIRGVRIYIFSENEINRSKLLVLFYPLIHLTFPDHA